jgi:hypothetical protein
MFACIVPITPAVVPITPTISFFAADLGYMQLRQGACGGKENKIQPEKLLIPPSMYGIPSDTQARLITKRVSNESTAPRIIFF